MPEASTIGRNLARVRHERGLSQEGLAEKSGLSRDTIAKLEQGRRRGERTTTLMRLANALDVELTELTGKRERLGTDRDGGSVLAIRDAILAPRLLPGLPGLDAADSGEPTPLPRLRAAVAEAWDQYWRGKFGPLTAAIPGLIGEARLTHRSLGVAASAPLAQAYQLTASLMEQFGKTDLAAIAAERGILAAYEGDDEDLWASVQRTYAWVLINQARVSEAEAHVVDVARRIEPRFSSASPERIAMWGNLLLTASWSALLKGNSPTDYLSLAAAGAERVGRRIDAYQAYFGPTEVAWHAVHTCTMRKEPGKALKAATRVQADDLLRLKYGRHLIDLAQAHVDARQVRTAEARLQEAWELSPVWFRHMEVARTLVSDVREAQVRPSAAIRRLAHAVGLD